MEPTRSAAPRIFAPFSVAGVLSVRGAPDPERVRVALDELQRRHTLLRARIVRQRRGRWFEVTPEVPAIPLKVVGRRDQRHWRDVANDVLGRSLDVETGPLLRCTYLYDERASEADFVFAYDHSTMDATSAWQLYGEFLDLCTFGPPAATPAPQQLPPSIDELLPARMSGRARIRPAASFMGRQAVDELRYRRTIKGRATPIQPTAQSYVTTRNLDAPETDALVRQARRRRLTMNSVMAAALLHATARELHEGHVLPMRATSFADLRPVLDPPQDASVLACYIAMLRLSLPVAPEDDLWAIADGFQARMLAAVERDEQLLAAGLTRQTMSMMLTTRRMRMGTTAVTYAGPLTMEPRRGIEVTDFHGFISNIRLGPVATAFVKILDERLSWDFVFLDTDFERATAESIADDTREVLVAAAGA